MPPALFTVEPIGDDGLPWYAMTLLSGVSLRDRLHRLRRPRRPADSRRLDPDASPNASAEAAVRVHQAEAIARQIADPLARIDCP